MQYYPSICWQGFTFPVAELFLEDLLEKTRYNIKSEFDNFHGNPKRRKRQQDSKKDPLMELFEACSSFPKYDPYPPNCFSPFWMNS